MTDVLFDRLTKDVTEKLDEKINQLFLEFQNQMYIAYGDVPLDVAFPMDEAQARLADCIAKTLRYELESENNEE